ncbi:MAG TPA: hypothetical protein VFR03_21450 [Thermoanaerobaculia bacterium]|nr:hypothetical protein [Thermoanaerobaculia bacterium]
MSQKQNLYVGRAGQMAVMAEFLLRGWNVALPEVDVGEDMLVVEDETGDLWRIQVKTANAKPLQTGYSALFNISLGQLLGERTPDLVYVFAIRSSEGWGPFVVVSRRQLALEHMSHGIGSISRDDLILRFSVQDSDLRCSDRDFLPYRNDWSRWPIIRH